MHLKVFSQFEFLNKSGESVPAIYENWRKYKIRVPVFGAILLDETLERVLNINFYHPPIFYHFLNHSHFQKRY